MSIEQIFIRVVKLIIYIMTNELRGEKYLSVCACPVACPLSHFLKTCHQLQVKQGRMLAQKSYFLHWKISSHTYSTDIESWD